MKKQTVSLLVLLLAASGFFFSCGNTVNKNAYALEFDSIQVNETVHLFGDTAKPACNLILNVAYASQSSDVRLKDSLNAFFLSACFGDKYMAMTPEEAVKKYKSAAAGKFNLVLGSQNASYKELDTDRATGCIRDLEHAYSKDGGLAVLKGNIAQDGCVVKTAGVDESIWKFTGPAKVFDSQDAACDGILGGKVVSGDVVVITHEGPKGGPGMQEMLYPTSYLSLIHI